MKTLFVNYCNESEIIFEKNCYIPLSKDIQVIDSVFVYDIEWIRYDSIKECIVIGLYSVANVE